MKKNCGIRFDMFEKQLYEYKGIVSIGDFWYQTKVKLKIPIGIFDIGAEFDYARFSSDQSCIYLLKDKYCYRYKLELVHEKDEFKIINNLVVNFVFIGTNEIE